MVAARSASAARSGEGESAVDYEPFGQRTVRLGLATSEQVREALETQRLLAEKAGLLGEILVEMGWLDPTYYIEIVQQLADDKTPSGRATVQERFTKLALEKGCVTPDQVKEGRRIQSTRTHKNKLIGQIMVEMGIIAPRDRDRVLATYKDNGHAK